jgi:hypothetical protein
MSRKVVSEAVVSKLFKKVIGLVGGGKASKAIKAVKGDKELQKSISDMEDAQKKFYKILDKKRKDPEYEKRFQKFRNL